MKSNSLLIPENLISARLDLSKAGAASALVAKEASEAEIYKNRQLLAVVQNYLIRPRVWFARKVIRQR